MQQFRCKNCKEETDRFSLSCPRCGEVHSLQKVAEGSATSQSGSEPPSSTAHTDHDPLLRNLSKTPVRPSTEAKGDDGTRPGGQQITSAAAQQSDKDPLLTGLQEPGRLPRHDERADLPPIDTKEILPPTGNDWLPNPQPTDPKTIPESERKSPTHAEVRSSPSTQTTPTVDPPNPTEATRTSLTDHNPRESATHDVIVKPPEPISDVGPGTDRRERVVWTLREPDLPEGDYRPLRNSPAVDTHGRIFACLQNELVAFKEKNGGSEIEVLWKFPTGGFIPGSPSVGPDGHVRVHSADGNLYCISTSREVCWMVRVGEPLGWASPSVDAQSNTWICSYNAGLIKVDQHGTTPSARPYFRCAAKFDCSGLILASTFFVGAEDQFVYAITLDGEKGSNRWDHSENRGRTGWFINSAPALLAGALLIVASRDDRLYAFNLEGELLWDQLLRGQMLASPVVGSDERVFVSISMIDRGSTGTGALVCLDGRSGTLLWEYAVSAPVESTPVVGNDGIIYFGDNSGAVHAVNANASNSKRYREPIAELGSPVRSAGTLVSPGRLVFGLDNGKLFALRCSSNGLDAGWPKYLGTLAQTGLANC